MVLWCFLPTRSYLKETAIHVLHLRDVNISDLGHNWTDRFLGHHPRSTQLGADLLPAIIGEFQKITTTVLYYSNFSTT